MSHLCRAKSWRSCSLAFRVMKTAIFLLLLLLASPCRGQQYENDKLLASESGEDDGFGYSVAISGLRALVGAPYDNFYYADGGSAHVFGYDSVTGTWKQEARLIAADCESWHYFGNAVSLSGHKALIGSKGDGVFTGSAYLFGYDSVSGTWQQEAKLLASDGDYDDQFGYSVALFGDRALVGAKFEEDNGFRAGAAYVYHYESASGKWQEEAKLVASDGTSSAEFGFSVSLSDDRALIGARNASSPNGRTGAAYLFRYDTVSGTWQEEAKLLASDCDSYDHFGESVSLSGTRALIGAIYGDDDNGQTTGSAYVFQYDSASGSAQAAAKLLASDGTKTAEFGYSVALSGTRALIGAVDEDHWGHESGAAYLFHYDIGLDLWREEAKLLASDGYMEDSFASSVALDGHRALVGAPENDNYFYDSGSAYAYDFTSVLALDVKCNGQDQNVIVNSSDNVTLTIDIKNGYNPNLEGDLWVLAVLPTSAWNIWTYGSWVDPIWQTGWSNAYYTGPPFGHSATVLDQLVPPGNYKLYFALDAIPDGVLNLTALWDFDVVDFTVQ